MKLKSYFSETVEDAMAHARQELGPEAMLVNTRQAPPEARHLGEYEVVFATEVAGVSPSTVSRWERGYLPPVEELARIA